MNIVYYVPIEIMMRTKEFLMKQGELDHEAYVLWTGRKLEDSNYIVTDIVIPGQKANKSTFGYYFDISEQSIAKTVSDLQSKNTIGLIQVHSHPGESALHSKRDDYLSLLGRKGALSIVLPYFGNVNFDDFSYSKVHMLTGLHHWELLSDEQVKKIMMVLR